MKNEPTNKYPVIIGKKRAEKIVKSWKVHVNQYMDYRQCKLKPLGCPIYKLFKELESYVEK